MPKTEKQFTELKSIKLTKKQVENWNPKNIKEFLDGNNTNNTDLLKTLKELHSLMVNKMDFSKEPNEQEIKMIQKVEELIK